jgi:hypothetical protein
MREIFTSGSVGGAPGNWCFYPELLIKRIAPLFQHRMPDTTFVSNVEIGRANILIERIRLK